MPKATWDGSATERFDLKSCPPDGYVVLRRLSYGEMLHRRDMVSKMTFTAPGNGRGAKDVQSEMKIAQTIVTEYEFKQMVVDHNLEDASGQKLDFGRNGTVASLDPRVGEEISTYIDKMNQLESAESQGNSLQGSELS